MPFCLLQIALFGLFCFCVGSIKKQCLPLSVLWDLLVVSTCWIQLYVLVTLFWEGSSALVISPGTLGKESKVYGPEEGCSYSQGMTSPAWTAQQPCHGHEVFVPKINKTNHFWSLPRYPSGFCQDINLPFEESVLTDEQMNSFCKVF